MHVCMFRFLLSICIFFFLSEFQGHAVRLTGVEETARGSLLAGAKDKAASPPEAGGGQDSCPAEASSCRQEAGALVRSSAQALLTHMA